MFEQIERQLRPGRALLILCILPDRLDFLIESDLPDIEAASIIRLDLVVARLRARSFRALFF
ncbi:hypothetical protein B5V01_21485 [Mesorhizobium erdmanii]|uniref:Uncharacterized protein n=2 Tax=Mesorhizobium TaxID=68287 RepID=A0A3M9X182_9HYPH|nr:MULTISPECIES: hypothetical protein [Mesorhizobium]RNJ41774.1 hypothetical protein DNR46_31690 [Mesorhizobium japonicum]RXT42817.1 hypothetical protein B5V01_21485 [Mesorhizobium erdmanii]